MAHSARLGDEAGHSFPCFSFLFLITRKTLLLKNCTDKEGRSDVEPLACESIASDRFRAKRAHLGQHLALIVLCVPYSLDSGLARLHSGCWHAVSRSTQTHHPPPYTLHPAQTYNP